MNKHMTVLLVVMAVTLVYFKASDYRIDRLKCIALVTVIMACFSGFRSWWMGDLIKYYTLYTQCNGEAWTSVVFEDYANIGIRLFFRGMGAMGISYDICIFMIAAFSAVTLSIVVYRYSPAPYWSYLMYIAMGFYLFTYTGLKQTIAMGFLMLAACGIFEDRPGKFLLWTLIGGMFHLPALIFTIAYPMARKKIDAMYFTILIAVILCISLYRDQIIAFFSTAYYEEEREYTAAKTIGGRALMMAFIMIVAVCLRPARSGDRVYCQVLNLMTIAAVIQYFSIYGNVYTRLADYYYQFVVLFMPMMLESGAHQLKLNPRPGYRVRCYHESVYFLLGVGITLFALWFYNSTLSSAHEIVGDFKFFWEIDPYELYGK